MKKKEKKIIPVIVAVIRKNQRYLLTKRRHNDGRFNNKWQFPGGELEYGEKIYTCLKREVKEELNLDIKKAKLIPIIYEAKRYDWHGLLFPYLCQLNKGEQNIKLDDEASDYRWFLASEIKKLKQYLPGLKEILKEVDKVNF
ncbi:hypothetical protein A3C98_03790 [Candidatus Roizmanbacteria bacterium RIFCSPHIGHO2_02_FULL_37_15]|uniref:Nudix hydrolase domain-containing protein n=1 Tax=Candidatus Roizmanbacteria bacterium RIFCSPLOWO2_01_FULL_37_16 TaxID=1802058 RepID=A0A1F7IKP6_9BACT|nr:MAG: hypothetical protein A2859_04945 [Candidatus Roizmanbacteria bacterium RIFCSPHIGHO2_01_FULL_37_16b]OGK21992.1 MAG: hypothetical protein A3C98_03790 [Candidatus Roizmanbacteria bacterium RIFCSPHIGHO2_02_FULL_37_15]OGK31753.1 MAG: hypothetical protein A3F57_00195 [Candidatus Roizmanbacteria bacterium RIFCSPHIGHO2_12_FULL_36_11]OGK43913.1 MAG: hypothetical protein A3B40_03830 [Candidatus Roizmanbacteria bacterium RIFCSPLOWO2_01_FULL_37_16]OGK56356.1 MAG: hypothetical protein A3I50_03495 [C